MAAPNGRHFPDWLKAYLAYASYSEAPPRMHFWTGVSVLAGCLQRKVWIDQEYFRWHPNFYIIFVAPPGVVSKSTTAGIGMRLLRQVPGAKFGPDVVTWPALITSFAESSVAFEYEGAHYEQSALTLESSEFGNLFNPSDREMVDLFVNLWDGKTGTFEKKTKGNGCDSVPNPWINLIACTTPSWIAGNFPEYLIGGGFTSRCVFVYAEEKEKFVAYPKLHVPAGMREMEQRLVEDLQQIESTLIGEYTLTPDAIAWGTQWYHALHSNRPEHLEDDRFGGYIARKQTHIHKTAMILAASCSNDLVITAAHLQVADSMVTDLEESMLKVFSRCGVTDKGDYADRIINFVTRRGRVHYSDVYKHIHTVLPSARDFEDVLAGCLRARHLRAIACPDGMWLEPWDAGDKLDAATAQMKRQAAEAQLVGASAACAPEG
jgi:hypothetical protein